MHSTLFGVAALAAVASAATHVVQVGQGGLRFVPNNTVAAKGDTVQYIFNPKNHTVTQGSFGTPCEVGNLTGGGFFSGFVPVANGTGEQAFEITVEVSTPIWFFCSQSVGNHCQSGMVGSINAPATGNTLDLYAANAKKTKSSEVPPGGLHGGKFVAVSSESSSGSSSTGSSTVSGGSSGESTAISSAPGSASTGSYNSPGSEGGDGGASVIVASGTAVSSSTATSTGPVQQTKNAAASLGSYGWRELFGLAAAAGGVAAYMV